MVLVVHFFRRLNFKIIVKLIIVIYGE